MSQENELKLLQEIERLKRQVERLKVGEIGGGSSWTFLTTSLTSTSWDGDAFSTTAKTKIDLSAVFGAPAGIKAVMFNISLRDSASQTKDCYFIVGATNVQYEGGVICCTYINDRWNRGTLISPCDANGDVYFQINASGTNTMDIYLSIRGYYL